jgi:hypothetical protein
MRRVTRVCLVPGARVWLVAPEQVFSKMLLPLVSRHRLLMVMLLLMVAFWAWLSEPHLGGDARCGAVAGVGDARRLGVPEGTDADRRAEQSISRSRTPGSITGYATIDYRLCDVGNGVSQRAVLRPP